MSAPHKEECDGPDIVTVDREDNSVIVFGPRVALDPLRSRGKGRGERGQGKEQSQNVGSGKI